MYCSFGFAALGKGVGRCVVEGGGVARNGEGASVGLKVAVGMVEVEGAGVAVGTGKGMGVGSVGFVVGFVVGSGKGSVDCGVGTRLAFGCCEVNAASTFEASSSTATAATRSIKRRGGSEAMRCVMRCVT